MNILLEIADRDIVFMGLGIAGLLIFGVVIFFVLTKEKVKPIPEDERFDNEKPELFPDIKPVTKEQQEAKAELERVFNQMANDLETKQPEPEVIESFEREQEESAIISYQELIKQAETSKTEEPKEEKTSDTILKDYLHEPQTTVKIKLEEPKEEPTQLKIDIQEENEPKKFKNSEIISPIFGVQSGQNLGVQNAQSYQEKAQEAPRHAYEEIKVAYESEDNAEFLQSLKEFRKNL